MKALLYIKKEACSDLSTKEFTDEWKTLSESDQATMREWAVEEGTALGVAVEAY